MYYRKPVTGKLVPDICTINFEDVKKTSQEGLTYTFPLRKNVKWDDGSPLTAHNFQFVYDLRVELELASSIIYQYVEYIRAWDNYTLEIKLGRCTPQLVYLIDKPYIVENVLQGYGGVAHSVVTPVAGEWYNPHVNKFGDSLSRDERIAKATEMLRDVGYTVPDTGYPEGVLKLPNGEDMQPFEILTTLSDYDPVRAECGLLIQDWWREIGVPVTVRQASFDEIFNKTFETMDFDWFILGWKLYGTGYPDHMRYFFHSDQSFPGGENPMDYWDTEVDRLLEDLVSLCDHDELVDAAWRAQEMIVEDVAYCPLYYRTLHEAHRNDTFTGWFTQLGGVAGAETPHYRLVYLQPANYQEKEGQPCLGSLLLVIFGGVAICWKMH